MAEAVSLEVAEKIQWLASKPKRVKIAVGGRGSTKSTGIGGIALMRADYGQRVCCTREFQNSIEDSVHENLREEIERLGVQSKFEIQANKIKARRGGELFYKGLARNITSLKSLSNVQMLWIEEGESVSKKSLKVLTPSVRSSARSNVAELHEPPEIWISMNRGRRTGAIADKYLKRAEADLAKTGYYEDDLIMVVDVNWRENPWFPPELKQEREDDFKNLPRAEYDAIWERGYEDSIENAIIKPEWFDACVDAHIKLGFEALGQDKVAYDPADCGDDKAVGYQHGSVLKALVSTGSGDVAEAAKWSLDFAIEQKPDVYTWDADGMGLGLKGEVNAALEGKKIEREMFRGSEGVDNPEQIYERDADTKKQKKNKEAFINKRAQYYFTLADKMRHTYQAIEKGSKLYNPDDLISFSSEIEELQQLRAELCAIPRKFNGSGRFQLYTKQEMKDRFDLQSPNRADVVMMLQRPVNIKKKTKSKPKYVGWGG